MKITYIAPAIKVIKLRTENSMLTGSADFDGEKGGIIGGHGSDIESNRNTSNMIWGDED